VFIIVFALLTRSIGTNVGMKLGINSYVAFVLDKAGELSVQIPVNPPWNLVPISANNLQLSISQFYAPYTNAYFINKLNALTITHNIIYTNKMIVADGQINKL